MRVFEQHMSSWPPEFERREVTIRDLMLPPFERAHLSVEELKGKLDRNPYWMHLNCGMSSDVYAREGYVLKVSVNDYGYDAFLETALQMQKNRYFPKIKEVKRYCSTRAGKPVKVTLVLMEQLHAKKTTERHAKRMTQLANQIADLPTYDYIPIKSISETEFEAATALGKLFREFGTGDIHTGNLMFRGNHPVVIDPVVYRYDVNQEALHY